MVLYFMTIIAHERVKNLKVVKLLILRPTPKLCKRYVLAYCGFILK